MKIVLLASVFFFLSQNCYSQYSSPESITYDSLSKRYFISNTSSQKIVQRDINGTVTDFVTVGGSIHGVTVHGNNIYVCNGTRVKGYNLVSAAEIFNVTITGSTFLNDLVIDNSGMMYVSDFSARRIYKVNTATSAFWTYVANTTNQPNGVYVDAPRNRLLICCWGSAAPIRQVNFADSSITTLVTTPYNNLDGISLDRNDNVYVSSWSIQSVVRYNINFTNAPAVVIGGLSNPADIYINKKTDTLAIPNAGNSTVVFHYLNTPSGINNGSSNVSSFILYQNFPNPFNPETIINYELAVTDFVSIKVFDMSGKIIATLADTKQNAGSYSIKFDGRGLASGIYFYKISAGGFEETRRMTLLK